MASTVTALRRAPLEPILLSELRQLLVRHTELEGHNLSGLNDLCLYRFSQPTSFVKAATFGVTLGVVVQGTKQIRLQRHALQVDPSQVIVVTRETEHLSAAIEAAPDRPFLGMGLCFGPERVARALLAICETTPPGRKETVPAFLMPFEPALGDAVVRLLRTLDDPFERRLLAPLVIDEILLRLLKSEAAAVVRAGVAPSDASRILESMQFIRSHHTQPLSVEQLARQVAMSSSHYAHRFRAVARTSPMRYLREVRLDQARSLLLQNGARAGEVAAQVGFESASHFTREFKRRFGTNPSQVLRVRASGRDS